ncbi:ABC transporter permease [Corynebacterium freiburgense]|uniref:ABC transporter permease n=1 Tax=Corynebacterium freiburgense TaxID=556548 RepID=UPI0004240D07|nr:ABC transporter permease [Corynebacterium freiburgense]WJZ02708.1 ABC-2 family transporter protein [Corynebacterium freiburgense]
MNFPNGMFAPDTGRAPMRKMILSQARIESLLFLRHGEQQLLSLVIPLTMLIALSLVPLIDNAVTKVFPLTLAIATMSAGFTGQAIGVAFDRRYGALKRIGASGVPPWTIIWGKIIAVLAVVILQTVLLTITAILLGWSMPATGLIPAAITLFFGVAAFASLGLLCGGTLGSELVLALANLIWFILLGTASYIMLRGGSGLEWVPSVALAQGLSQSFAGQFPTLELGVLFVWLLVGALGASRFFRFTA